MACKQNDEPRSGGTRKADKTEIVLQTRIDAPLERCFDLARSIDFHVQSASSTKEQAVGGVTSGLIAEGQEVEWKAKHFGLWWKMRVRITDFRRPDYFQDRMVKGPFSSFTHDHSFRREADRTLMVDRIRFRSPLPVAGRLIDAMVVASHLRKFVESRNAALKTAAESDQWRSYLQS